MTRIIQTELTYWKPTRELALAAQTDVPVMVTARSSNERRTFARFIHDSGVRHKQPFVAVSFNSNPHDEEWSDSAPISGTCAADLVSTWFEQAAGGTLFLDDLERMSGPVQEQLCSALCYPLETRREPHEVRIITGTRPAWPSASDRQRFSDRLYYRLNVIRVDCSELPHRHALREPSEHVSAFGAVVESQWAVVRPRLLRGR